MTAVNDNRAGDRETRRRKLLFRAWHRGTKEMDLLLGGFARERLPEMESAELDAFERLLNIPDQEFYDILVSGDGIPQAYDGPMMREIVSYAGTRFEEDR